MKRRWSLVVLALTACGPSAPPPTTAGGSDSDSPTPAVASAPRSGPTSAMVDAEPAPPLPPFAPKPPFSIVARAPGTHVFDVLPAGRGEAWIVAGPRDGRGTLAWARTRASGIETFSGGSRGLPADLAVAQVANGAPRPLRVSARGDVAWLAVETGAQAETTCEVFTWRGDRWASRGAPRPPGSCSHLAAWTPGSALVVVGDATLAVAGDAPKVMPVLGTGPRGECLVSRIDLLDAWDTGEALIVGVGCTRPEVWIQRWAARTRLPASFGPGIDPDAPYLPVVRSPSELTIDGGGILADPSTEVAIRSVVRFERGRFTEKKADAEVNALEMMLVEGAARVGASTDEVAENDVTLDGFRIVDDDVYAVVTVVRLRRPVETLLLRDRPVDVVVSID